MTTGIDVVRAAAFAAVLLWIGGAVGAMAQPASDGEGMRIYKSANCVGCHKWSGNGGGSYGGAAANLRQTQLSLSEIEETIRCGRPMAGMPHFQLDAYADGTCYGLKESDLADGKMPPEANRPLRPADIKAVAEYVVSHIKGQGDPTFTQCQAFFGAGTRVCDVYAKQSEGGSKDTASSGPVEASPHPHMQVEAAGDANAPGK